MPRRELIDTGTDKRYVRRDGRGQFKESDDAGRSFSPLMCARRPGGSQSPARATVATKKKH